MDRYEPDQNIVNTEEGTYEGENGEIVDYQGRNNREVKQSLNS